LSVGQILMRTCDGHTGVVHNGIERVPGLRKDGGGRALDRGRIVDIERLDRDLLVDPRRIQRAFERSLFLQIAHRGEHAPAFGRQGLGRDPADSRRSARNENVWHSLFAPRLRFATIPKSNIPKSNSGFALRDRCVS